MKFLSLTHAAKRLHTTTEGLIGMAAKGQVVLTVDVPPGISIWEIESLTPDSKGQVQASKASPFSHLDIGKQDCLDLLTGKITPKHPIHAGGYLKSPTGSIRYHPVKDWARRKSIKENPECRIIVLPGYGLTDTGDGNLVTLRESNSEPQHPDLQIQDAGPESVNAAPSTTAGGLVSVKLGKLERIGINKESLLITVDRFNTLREKYLPPDEMIDHSHASAFMLDMNSVAREMFGRALRKRRVYPCREEVIEALSETESFKNAAVLLSDKEKKVLGKFQCVAADFIRPGEILGKGDKVITGQSYLSEKFKVLIAISRKFSKISEKEPSKDVRKKHIVEELEKNGIPINTRSTAALLINPSSISDRGRPPGVIEHHKRIRVQNN